MQDTALNSNNISYEDFKKQILEDYKIAVLSRECSVLGRREVLTGKAKFGIFGDGKEIPQIAMAKMFQKGDFRSGYYRDQTFMMASGLMSIEEFFAGLYGHTDLEKEPMSGGRQMGAHFSTPTLNEDGSWKNLMQQKNSSSDISPTAGQMSRLLGLAEASKIYRHIKDISNAENFSNKGNEIAWGTIGDASTSEGVFWEIVNAACVRQVPLVMNIWDDGYGISVHKKYQTPKGSISTALRGFERHKKGEKGLEILNVNGWNYPDLIDTYQKASAIAREKHVPVVVHVEELTQPQGHSTSGSHERYKSKERLSWEKEYDCNTQMRKWIINQGIAPENELQKIEKDAQKRVRKGKQTAWKAFNHDQLENRKTLKKILEKTAEKSKNKEKIIQLKEELTDKKNIYKYELLSIGRRALRETRYDNSEIKTSLLHWVTTYKNKYQEKYSSSLYSENERSARAIKEIEPVYNENAEEVDGRVVLRENFDKILANNDKILIFGEDSGKMGDVNQGLEGLQDKYGKLRVDDTGIREAAIIGHGIGLALRGFRPIAEIQYVDYTLYCLNVLSDDLATLHYRTNGRQKAPVIVRTRGHRLEGIWHSGSPMGGLIHFLRGVNILVPRNMIKAAGFYNTMLLSDEPAFIIESLNGYRLKEKMPENIGEFRTPVGQVEVLKPGKDVTVVSYGSTLRLVEKAAEELTEIGIDIEIIDVQSLLPLDLDQDIAKSLEKTSRLLVVDEDVPGGASAYIVQNIVEKQDGYHLLDSLPHTLTAQAHRPAYTSDGDYFSKPSTDDIFEKIYTIMNEAAPEKFPDLY